MARSSIKSPKLTALLAAAVVFIMFSYTFLNDSDTFQTANGVLSWMTWEASTPEHPTATGLLINSTACKMSDYDPWDATLADVLRKETSLDGCGQNYPVKFEQAGRQLTFSVNEEQQSGCTIECCYRGVVRDKEGKSDEGYKYSGEPVCFGKNRSVRVDSEFVHLWCVCSGTETVVYEDYRAFILPKKVSRALIADIADVPKEKRLNIYMVVMDSVSRLNFRRQMPEIEKKLSKLGAIPLLGLTKVGKNTLPNMLPLLADMTIEDFWKSYGGHPLDGLPLLWKNFSRLGYHTLYSEDQESVSTFNYMQKGFYITPTDYYMRPLFKAIAAPKGFIVNVLKYLKGETEWCINQRLYFELQLDWLKDLVAQPGDTPHFALVFSNSLSHQGPLQYVHPMQAPLNRFLDTFLASDRSNSSVLFLFSDHGMRFGEIMKTEIGGYEARLPAFYALFPPWFAKRYPERVANLRANSHRLTTFFDVHATLRDLLRDAGGGEEELPAMRHAGISLFKPVPVERSCEDAQIPPHWCLCRARLPLPPNNTVVARAASEIVRHMNDDLLRNVREQCVELRLSRIIAAFHTMSEGRREQDESDKRQWFEEMSVQVVTEPGPAEFEATVRCWKGKPPKTAAEDAGAEVGSVSDLLEKRCLLKHPMTVLDISRINLYKGQSDCIKDSAEERLYCYCKDLL